jgi:serine/threonine protein phosphatase PrpC
MPRPASIRFDVASAMALGRRDYQEDALATDFPAGSGPGLVVLADGMGGHAAGDVASKIVVSETFSGLKLASEQAEDFASTVPAALRAAADAANGAIRAHWTQHRDARGMGATLVALVFDEARLWWLSIGDSPLLLYRAGAIRRLNEDHSLAPQIDYLVLTGQMDPEAGRTHPDRSCLTSVVAGDRVERIDVSETPLTLREDDIVIVASDGLESLDGPAIARILTDREGWPAADLAEALLQAVMAAGDPEQDNVSFTIVRPTLLRRPLADRPARARPQPVAHEPAAMARLRLAIPGFPFWRRGGSATGDSK